jgi:hypothetical protein
MLKLINSSLCSMGFGEGRGNGINGLGSTMDNMDNNDTMEV